MMLRASRNPPHLVVGRLVIVWWQCAFWSVRLLNWRLGRLNVYWWLPYDPFRPWWLT